MKTVGDVSRNHKLAGSNYFVFGHETKLEISVFDGTGFKNL